MNKQPLSIGSMDFPARYVFAISVFLLWLTHISALIGISIGHLNWFIPKTPFNLLMAAALPRRNC